MLLNCVVGERLAEFLETLESSSESKEIKSVNPKGNQPQIFIGKIEGRRRRG